MSEVGFTIVLEAPSLFVQLSNATGSSLGRVLPRLLQARIGSVGKNPGLSVHLFFDSVEAGEYEI